METLQPVLLATLLGCVCLVLVREGRVPDLSGAVLLKGAAFVAVLVALAVSDYPASWRLGDLVVYLAEVSLAPFRVLLVFATGVSLFGGMLWLLYLAGRGRGRRRRGLTVGRKKG